MRVLAALALALGAAACGELPKPFAHAQQGTEIDRELLNLPDSPGIMILPVDDAPKPVSAGLVAAMVAELGHANVPASARVANKASYFLESRIVWSPAGPERTNLLLLWRLRDSGGSVIGRHLQHETAPRDQWDAASPALFQAIAARAVPEIVRFVQDEAPGPAAAATPRVVAVLPVQGAPGDGDKALTRAVTYLLDQAGVRVVTDIEGVGAIVLGTVVIGPPRAGVQPIRIDWRVTDPNGEEIGVVNQNNNIPAGMLDGAWGEIAYAVAGGAVEGIVAVLERMPAASPPTP